MKKVVTAVAAVVVAGFLGGPIVASTATTVPPTIDADAQALPSLAPLIERISPAVVNISVRGTVAAQRNPLQDYPRFRPFFDWRQGRPAEREFQAVGSGVIVDAEAGYILTNSHVIANAEEIGVTLRDGRHLDAVRVGSDPESDVVVIQIPAEDLVALPQGDSNALRVGDYVVAIGNPFGLQNTVTSGIVSAKGRSGLGIEGYEDFIQTDASINPGNSGGALVNLAGELIGINTAIIGPGGGNVGIGFAIPINMAQSLMAQLIAHGEIRRGVIGVRIQDLTPDLPEAFGVESANGAVIASVVSDSPAEVAGLRNGDIIVAGNGAPIRNAAALRGKIGSFAAGDTVEVAFLRDGEPASVEVRLGTTAGMAAAPAEPIDACLAGVMLGPVPADESTDVGIEGVLVVTIDPQSPAFAAGLRERDVIVSINQNPVHAPQELNQTATAEEGKLLLHIRRGEDALFIAVG